MVFKTQTMAFVKAPETTPDELAEHLVRNYNVYELADFVAEKLLEKAEPISQITITAEQLAKYFKVVGRRYADGDYVRETRGRKKGSKLVDGKVCYTPMGMGCQEIIFAEGQSDGQSDGQ